METKLTNPNNFNNKPLATLDSPKVQEEEEKESNSLLSPRKGGMSKKPRKLRRTVQWNDRNGNKLVQIWEFQPSDTSDTEDEDSDSCICTIM